jgi:DNA-binding MarR family transcriptional regulator
MAQCYALLEIGRKDEISIVELAGILGADTSTLSRTVDGAVRVGLIDRVLNPQDRRYVSLTLTEQGRTVFHTIENAFNGYLARVFELIPPEKHAQVMESLVMLAAALEQCGKEDQCCTTVATEQGRYQND